MFHRIFLTSLWMCNKVFKDLCYNKNWFHHKCAIAWAAIRKWVKKNQSKTWQEVSNKRLKCTRLKSNFCVYKNKTINKRLIKLGNLLVKFFLHEKTTHTFRYSWSVKLIGAQTKSWQSNILLRLKAHLDCEDLLFSLDGMVLESLVWCK